MGACFVSAAIARRDEEARCEDAGLSPGLGCPDLDKVYWLDKFRVGVG